MNALRGLRRRLATLWRLPRQLDAVQEALARVELRQLEGRAGASLAAHEFRAFSQFGEDGILQYLVNRVPVASRSFVEFGVADYLESNTRFLLQHDNWSGLVIDGGRENVEFIRRQEFYWRHTLRAVCAFVTAGNIDTLLADNGVAGEIGVLSIDLDGNDYWVWKAIGGVRPAIVVCEYNSLFGATHAVTVPYDAAFDRRRAHWSCLYFGASLPALEDLGRDKGYALVGSNSAGNNAFFVRRDLLGTLAERSARDCHVRARFREARDPEGRLSFPDDAAAGALVSALPLVDCRTGETTTLARLAGSR